ncbi:META domain-containing protein [Corynebacterium sp. TA-R-1]|uniref:META domain-containing protein n=1 Tax=Corynebacterium stercoris TaxID=2943490 RepID=A0ABT1FY18_9CORY|nr:META domain-containing protein [Corynebacterium stercoris]MCP1386644.1 META domain-containing protein [Corynebacterium stercoris]
MPMPVIPIQAIIAAIVALAAALGIGLGVSQSGSSESSSLRADGSSEYSRLATPKVLKPLPAAAVRATPEQVNEILRSTWLPVPDYDKTPIAFKERDGVFVTATKACNGFGVGITPKPSSAEYTFQAQATTEMYCGGATEYEAAIFEAFAQGTHFAVVEKDGKLDTAYVAGPKGALKLTRVQ